MDEIPGSAIRTQETNSEAARGYATAAFLVGMALMAVGAGLGYILGDKRKPIKDKPAE